MVNMIKDFVKHRIYRWGNEFRCRLCKENLSSKSDVLSHIADDQKHLLKLKKTFLIKFNLNQELCLLLFNHGITVFTVKNYKCEVCQSLISVKTKLDQLTLHVSGKKHSSKKNELLLSYDSNDENLTDLEINDEEEDQISCDNDKNTADDNVNNTADDQEDDSTNQNDISKNNEPNEEKNDCNENNCNNVPADDSEKQVRNSIVEDNFSKNITLANNVSISSTNQVSTNDNIESSKLSNTMKKTPICITTFTCNICQDVMETYNAWLFHRMFHLDQKSDQNFDILNFYIKNNCKQIYCLICDCIVQSEDNLEKHLKEFTHMKRLLVLQCPHDDAIVNMMYINSTFYPKDIPPVGVNNLYNSLNQEFIKYFYFLQQTNDGINSQNHFYNQTSVKNLPDSPYFCFICNKKFLDEKTLSLHYNCDYNHKFRMESINFLFKDKNIKFVNYDNDELIRCLKCNLDFTEIIGATMHLREIQHTSSKYVTKTTLDSKNVTLNHYNCSLCKIHVTNNTIFVHHLTSDYHKKKSHEYYANNNEWMKKIYFLCPICQTTFFHENMLLHHIHTKQCFVIKSNFINAPQPVYMVPNTLPRLMVPNNNLIMRPNFIPSTNCLQSNTLNRNDKYQTLSTMVHKNILPVNNPKKPIVVYKKNLVNFSPRYVRLCIEKGKENIFTVNNDKIKNLELSISLTFPHESKRCCIPCGIMVSNDLQLFYEHLRSEKHQKNLQEMKDNDLYFENFYEQFSDLNLARSYMVEKSEELVDCFACVIKLKNTESLLKEHISSVGHVKNYQFFKNSADKIIKLFNDIFDNLWYYIEKFQCHVCNKKFEYEIDYVEHLEGEIHLKEVEKKLIKNQTFEFDFCIVCASYWYAKTDFHENHCSNQDHMYILKSRDFTVPKINDDVNRLLIDVDDIVDKLIEESDKSVIDRNVIEKQLLKNVEEIVKPVYPLAKAYLFESRISNLSFKDSDLDIYLDCNNEYNQLKPREDKDEQLNKVQKCFYKQNILWKIDEIVKHTRVPIIRLKHKATNLNCDISFINGLSVEKSKILG